VPNFLRHPVSVPALTPTAITIKPLFPVGLLTHLALSSCASHLASAD